MLAGMKHVDLERLIVCSALSGFAFLSFAGLVSAPLKCPSCGWKTWWKLREDQRSEQPHFFCGRVIDQGQRAPTTGRKRGWKTVNRKVCLCNRSWRAWSPEFKDELPHLDPCKLTRVFWHWSMMHPVAEAAFETGVHEERQK